MLGISYGANVLLRAGKAADAIRRWLDGWVTILSSLDKLYDLGTGTVLMKCDETMIEQYKYIDVVFVVAPVRR